jgi:excisionase family DNA binding protein
VDAIAPIRPELAEILEAAAVLRISRSKLYELIDEGQIERVKIGRRAFIRVAELERFASSLGASGGRAA